MYGLRPEIDLGFLIGKEIEQVAVGPQTVEIRYVSGEITVESKFRLRTSDEHEFEWARNPVDAGPLAQVVSARITGVFGQPDGTLMIRFSNGATLTLFDSPAAEAYTITEAGRKPIVV